MTTAQSLYRRFGALELPIPADTSTEDASRLDPARDILLDLFAAALISELEPVWARAVAGTPIAESSPVAFKLPALPDEDALKQLAVKWPVLAVGRSEKTQARFAPYSLSQTAKTQSWDVDYILAPLTAVNELRVKDVLSRVPDILALVIETGGHLAYQSVVNGNAAFPANVLSEDCGFLSLTIREAASGVAVFAKGGPRYLHAGLTLESVEVSSFTHGADGIADNGIAVPLTGATGTFGLSESGDPAIRARS